MAILTCENASFSYDGRTVLEGVDFALNAGDYLCVVGENGSGKSTLIRGLLSLKAPASGKITLGDGLKRSEIGYLPQQTEIQRDFPASVWEVAKDIACRNEETALAHAVRERAHKNGRDGGGDRGGGDHRADLGGGGVEHLVNEDV